MRIDQQAKIAQTAERIRDLVAPLRAQGRTLVTTNGCFDLLHAGHVQYLGEAARLGDILVVGINRDQTVRRQKGDGRPVQSEQDRCAIVAALGMVDYAFLFAEDDPRAFLEILRPNVHVKGGDYDASKIIERQVVESHGGTVRTVSFVNGRSTTQILSRASANR